MIAEKSEIIRRLKLAKTSYKLESLTMYDIKNQKYQLQFFVVCIENMKGLLKQQTLEEPNLGQLHKVLCKCLYQCVLKENS